MKPTRKNKGSVYILTLAASLVLVSLVLGLCMIITRFRQTSRTDSRIDRANIYAELGIRHGMHFTTITTNWRNILSSGNWLDNINVDQATYILNGTDPVDGILNNSDEDPVILQCTATVDDVSRTLEVQTWNAPLLALKYALTAGGTVSINDNAQINGDLSSNADIIKSGINTWIYGNADAVGEIGETNNITGSVKPQSAPKCLPNSMKTINYYQTRATLISYLSLDSGKLENVLLSPTSNPYGLPNPDGLYLINCANQDIDIRNCRIVGTLVLINVGNNSRIRDAVNWQSARPDYPALIVQGDITIKTDRILDENVSMADFNLPGEPGYGVSGGQVFPNLISGTIYCDGNLTLSETSRINGPVIASGDVLIEMNAVLTSQPTYYDQPPKSFRQYYLTPIRGTWRKIIPTLPQ